jgi:hypothetical protein
VQSLSKAEKQAIGVQHRTSEKLLLDLGQFIACSQCKNSRQDPASIMA